MNKITFERLDIELTRRCNMACAHCMRGDAQNIDIDRKHIDAILEQTQLIGKLFFTGGEPFLALDTMEYIADQLCKRGIPLLNFEVITNGSILDSKVINIIKRYKKIIDTSCKHCLNGYNAAEGVSRCIVGVSLDRYHTDHDKCFKNYERLKKTLNGFADVVKIMRGNIPKRLGRANYLKEHTTDNSYLNNYYKLRRIELLSKDHKPICPVYDSYKMFSPEQKIVCCDIYMNVFGQLSTDAGGATAYNFCDAFPKICNANEPVWESIIAYNKDKMPCAKWEAVTNQIVQKNVTKADIQLALNIPKDARDEPTKAEIIDTKQKLAKTGNAGIIGFLISEMANAVKTQNWEQIASGAQAKDYSQ